MSVANSSNITTIQILRSYSNTTPTTLDDGQLAYSFVSNTLFIGSNTGIKVVSNPPTDVRAQEAYNQANTATVLANAAYFHANGAFLKANAAFDNSNTKLSLSGGTITGPISGPGESKLDFTTYGANSVYLTTTNDDTTALFMGAVTAELYADTNVQIRANTKGTSQNWTFGAEGTLTFPDSTIQTTAYVPNDEVDNVARAAVNAAYFHANGAFLKANAAFDKANTGGVITGNVYISSDLSVANTITTNTLNISTNTSNVSLTRGTGITSWNYSGKFKSISAEESAPTGLFLSPDGLNMYVNGTTGDDVNQYTLSTAWNVSTATFVRLFSTSAQDSGPTDVFFKPDGLSMFIMGNTNDTVFQYTLSSAFDISTATYASKSFSVTSQDTTPQGLWFKPDGTVMYMVGSTTDAVYQYTLGTAWDVSTASYANIFFSVATQESGPVQVNLSADGLTMWILGSTGDDISQYALGTAFNVSTAVFQNSFYVGFEDTNPQGLFIDSTAANRVYFVGQTNDTVYQYNTDTNSINITTDVLTVNNNARIQGNLAVQSSAYVDGSATIQGALSVGGSTSLSTTSISGTLSGSGGVLLDGSATNTIRISGSQTTGNLFIGGATQTGNITFGYSSVNQTANIANGTTAAGSTKVVNLGTSAGSGSNTQINIGPSTAGANGNVTFNPATTVAIQNTRASTSTTTGALTVLGGVGVSGNVYADGLYDGGVEVLSYLQGVDNTQNTRLTVIEGTNLSQNVRLDFSNTRMNIIDGVDVTQNTRLTVIEGTNLSQNVRIDYSNTALTIAQGVDNSQNVRLDFSNTRMTIIEGVDLSQNVRLDFSNTRMTIIEGVDAGQNSRMSISDGVNASQNVRLDFSNAAITIIQGVDVGQNSRMTIIEGIDASQNVRLDFSNTRMTIIDGVDAGQNNRMAIIEGTDTSQNARMAIIEGTNASQNVRIDYSNTAITIIQGVDVTQNTRLTVSEGVDLSQNVRIDYSNTAITIIQGVDVTQNTRLTVSEGVDLSQNVRLDFSNTRMNIIDGVDAGQNARMTIIEGVDITQNTNISNRLALTGAASQTVTGNVVFGNDVTVTGNLVILGNTISLNVSSLEVEDTLIQLGIGNYYTDALTIGYVGHYNDGTNAHAGMIRDALTKEFYAFQGYTPEVTGNVINVNAASFTKANIHGNWFKGNLIATTARVGGLDVNSRLDFSNTRMAIIEGVDVTQNTNIAATDGKMQSAYNVANTADVRSVAAYFHANGAFIKANAAFDSVNVQIGVDTTQNTRMSVIEGTDLSQNVSINTQNSFITIIQGVDLSQNVRLDFSNTRMNIIDGVDAGQNARMTIIEGVDVTQNTRLTVSEGVDLSQNVSINTQNSFITIIQGVDVDQNARMTISDGVNASQNVRIDYSNTALTIAQGVDDSQNVRLNYSNTVINQIQSAWTANTVIVANLAGFLSNSSVFFTASNNALITTGAVIAAGDISVATGQFVNVGGPGSGTRIRRDSSLNGLDLQTSSTSRLFIADTDGSVNIRSTTASTSNNTGALIVAGGIGTKGSIYSTGGLITINNGLATTGNSGTIFLGDSSFSKTFGSGFIFNSSISAQQFVANAGSNSAAAFTFSGVGNLGIYAPLTGVLGITANSANALFVSAPASSVNYLNVSANTTGNAPTMSAQGSDTNIDINILSKGTGSVNLLANGSVSFSAGSSAGGPQVAYLKTLGTPTGGAVYTGVISSDTNTSSIWFTKGSGSHFFNTNSGATTQFLVSHTASAVNYIQVAGNVTGQQPYFLSAGSDTNVGITYATKGTGSHFFSSGGGVNYQFNISNTNSAVNYLQATGNTTGGGPVLSSQGTDTNVDLNISSKNTGAINLNTGNGIQFRVEDTFSGGASTNYWVAQGRNGGQPLLIVKGADTNINGVLCSKGTGSIGFATSSGSTQQFNITHTASAVNNLQVTGNTTGGGAVLSAQGSDTNVGINITPKGAGSVNVTSTTSSTSNTSGALVVNGGLGLSGNLTMNLSSSGAGVNRLTLSQSAFIQAGDGLGNLAIGGSAYWYFNNTQGIYIQNTLHTRGVIYNDTGNNTVLFFTASPVKIQNGTASSNTTTGALVVQGGVGISGALNATTKSFNIPHPTKEGKDLRYGSLEGPEFGVYVRGTLKGSNVIELPDYWTKLVDANTITVSLTSIGKHQKLSVKEVKDNTVIISSDGWFKKEIHCYYVVYGERADVDKLDVEG